MRRPALSIRNTLLIIIGLLNLLIAMLVGSDMYKAWVHLKNAQNLADASRRIDLLYTANKSLSLERAAVLPLVNAPPQIADALQIDLPEIREELTASLTQALRELRPDQALAPFITKVETQYQNIQALRKQLDAALRIPVSERSADLPDRLFGANTDLIKEIQNLILEYERSLKVIDVTIARQLRFKASVWELAEYAGRENAIIGRLIVEQKPPSAAQRDELMSWRGRVQYGWEIIRRSAVSSGLSQPLAKYIEEAETHYFLTFDPIKEMFYDSNAQTGESYPISIEIWLGLASQAVDSLLELQNTVLSQTRKQVVFIEAQAQNDIYWNVAILFSAIILSLYCWSVIVMRVTRPVNKMVDSLYQAAQDDQTMQNPSNLNHDEIGKLNHVLKAFHENSRKIKQSNEELERYAYIAAHDLKSPLRAIDNLSQWIEEDLGERLQGKTREHMDALHGRVRRMEKLLDDTLAYSRLEPKLKAVSTEILSARTLVQDISALLSVPKNFVIHMGPGLETVQVHRFPLQQVLYNLISNAVKHHDKETGRITVDVEDKGTQYVFSVRDDGPGIEPQYHQRIFDMFQTLKPRDEREGSGMGLAIVRKILTNFGCTITVESQTGQGAVFRFTWPKLEELSKHDRKLYA